MLALASLVTTLVFLVVFIVSFVLQRNAATAKMAQAGKDISGVLELVLNGPMSQGDGDAMREIFRQAGDLNKNLTMHITDKAGTVKYTTSKDLNPEAG